MLITGAAAVFLSFIRMRRIKALISAAEILDDDAIPTDTLLLLLVAALIALLATFALHVS